MRKIFLALLFFISFWRVSLSQSGNIFLPVKVKDKWGLIDTSGKQVLKAQYDYITPFRSDGYAITRKNELHGFINYSGTFSEPLYEEIRIVDHDYVEVKQHEWKMLRAEGNKIIFNLKNGSCEPFYKKYY